MGACGSEVLREVLFVLYWLFDRVEQEYLCGRFELRQRPVFENKLNLIGIFILVLS